jgi:DNA end-binding protein Ku
LLREAMSRESKVAVATLVMRNKEYLVTVRPHAAEPVLILQTMYFNDEVRSPAEELPNLPKEETFSDRELAIASQLIDAMASPWDPDHYRDTHRERVEELVASKHEGREIVLEVPPPAPKVVDLMAALEASVKAASGGRERTPATAAKATKKAAPAAAKGDKAEKTAEPRRAARRKAS